MLVFLKFSFLLGGIVSLFLGAFIYFRDKKQIINKTYAWLSFCSAIWSFGFFALASTNNSSTAYFWRMFMDTGAIFIPAFWMHFVYAMLGINLENKKEIIFYYFLSVVLAVLNFSDYFLPGIFIKNLVSKGPFNYYPTAGVGYYLFLLLYITAIPYSLYFLVKSYFKSSGVLAKQIKYLITAAAVGFIGGGMTFFLTFDVRIIPYGVIFFAFYPIIVAYAITKHHLFNIKIIATELFIFTICILLVVRMLLSVNPLNIQDIILNLIILVSALFIGFLAIKNAAEESRADKIVLEDTRQSLDLEKRLRHTFAEIAEERIKRIEEKVFSKK